MCSFTLSNRYRKNYEATAELEKRRAPDHRGECLGEKGKAGGNIWDKWRKIEAQKAPPDQTTASDRPSSTTTCAHRGERRGDNKAGQERRQREALGDTGYTNTNALRELITNHHSFLTLQRWLDSVFSFSPPGRPLSHHVSLPLRANPPREHALPRHPTPHSFPGQFSLLKPVPFAMKYHVSGLCSTFLGKSEQS